MSGFKINKQAFNRMQRDIQKELDKRPVHVRVEAEPPRRIDGHFVEPAPQAPTTVHNYSGPVVNVSGDGNPQIAFSDGGDINQSQQTTFQIAPEYKELAEVVTELRAALNNLDLTQEDVELGAEAADEVLTAVAQEEPDPSIIRRAVAVLKGILAPVMAGANQAITSEVAERAGDFFNMLGTALPA